MDINTKILGIMRAVKTLVERFQELNSSIIYSTCWLIKIPPLRSGLLDYFCFIPERRELWLFSFFCDYYTNVYVWIKWEIDFAFAVLTVRICFDRWNLTFRYRACVAKTWICQRLLYAAWECEQCWVNACGTSLVWIFIRFDRAKIFYLPNLRV